MKKILSFVLVLAMIASMMCISVSALNVVGSHGVNGDITDGVERPTNNSFALKNNVAVISANVNGSTVVRYAVDLVYTQKTITIAGELVWDVNKLQYEGTKTITMKNGDDTELNNVSLENGINKKVENVGEFAITNYSNADVTVQATVLGTAKVLDENGAEVDKTDRAIYTILHETGITENVAQDQTAMGDDTAARATVIGANDGTATSSSTVPGVQGVAVNQQGYTHTVTYAADMYCNDWATALYDIENEQLTIATITFTITPAN